MNYLPDVRGRVDWVTWLLAFQAHEISDHIALNALKVLHD